jgi:hypothetical protein
MQRASFAEACNTGNCIKQKYFVRRKLQGATERNIWKYQKCNTIQTFCSKVRFLHSFERNGPQCPIRFFSQEQETISLSACSARDSIAISTVAPSPSSAFMPCACQHHKIDNKKLKSHERIISQIQNVQMVKDVQPSKNYL